MKQKSIGIQIKKLREKHGLTLQALANKAGISKGYLWQLENGETNNPSIDIIYKISKAIGVTVEEIIYGKPPAYDLKLDLPDCKGDLTCLVRYFMKMTKAKNVSLVFDGEYWIAKSDRIIENTKSSHPVSSIISAIIELRKP